MAALCRLLSDDILLGRAIFLNQVQISHTIPSSGNPTHEAGEPSLYCQDTGCTWRQSAIRQFSTQIFGRDRISSTKPMHLGILQLAHANSLRHLDALLFRPRFGGCGDYSAGSGKPQVQQSTGTAAAGVRSVSFCGNRTRARYRSSHSATAKQSPGSSNQQ